MSLIRNGGPPLKYLNSDQNELYRHGPDGTRVQVDATIRFWQKDCDISFVAVVVLSSNLPNGILLGQFTFLGRIRYESRPRCVLEARGIPRPWSLLKRVC